MKNDFEMYQSVLSRRNEHRLKKERRVRIFKRTAPVLAGFIFTVVLGLGYWNHFGKMPIILSDPDIVEFTTEAITSQVTGNLTTVTTIPITTKTSKTQKTTSVTATTKSISTSYTVTQAYTQAVNAKATYPITTKVQTAFVTTSIATVTSAITTQINSGSNMGGFGNDMAVHTLPQSYTTVSDTELTVTSTSTTSVSTTTNINIPSQPMNEKYPLAFLDGDITLYRNTYRISPDNVGEYIGIAGMRGQSSPIYKAKAFKIKDIDYAIAIAVEFEEDDGYYLYRSNETNTDTIKELISPAE